MSNLSNASYQDAASRRKKLARIQEERQKKLNSESKILNNVELFFSKSSVKNYFLEDREPIDKFSWPRDIQYFGDFYHKHIDKLRYFEILKKIDDLIFPKSGTIYFDEYRYFGSFNVNFEYLTNIANFGIAISDTIMFISEDKIFAVLLDYYHVSGTHGEHDYSIAVNSKDAHDLIPNCFSESS